MNCYRVIYGKSAEKFIKANKEYGIRFVNAFLDISTSKKNISRYDIKKYQGKRNAYRLRIGQYRAIFQVLDEKLVIAVIDIDSRGGIYK